MEPAFTLPYSEFAVIEELSNYLKKQDGFSAYVPVSRQQKGIDFLIHNQTTNKHARFQVKASRSYKGTYKHNLWFNNFHDKYVRGACDYYCLFGLYPEYANSVRITGHEGTWRRIVLCLRDEEMGPFLNNVMTKKEPRRPDRFYGIGFDTISAVYGTRGFDAPFEITELLLAIRVRQIREFLS